MVEDGVFIGPHVCFTNDRHPHAINPDGSVQAAGQWELTPILVRSGASLGAACVLVAGMTVGRWALVAAGALVTKDVFGLVAGNPARRIGSVCVCGRRLPEAHASRVTCANCGRTYRSEADGSVTPE
jgi:acetyltransferase-like isoleucine patch superfamily enzyme